jgi:hypothetical protein
MSQYRVQFFVQCRDAYVLVGLGERVSRHGGYQLNRKKLKKEVRGWDTEKVVIKQEARENLSRPRVLSYDTRPSNNFFAGSEIGAIPHSATRYSSMCAGHRTPAALGVAMNPYGLRFHCRFAPGKVSIITFQVARVACLNKEVRLLLLVLIYAPPPPPFPRLRASFRKCRSRPFTTTSSSMLATF